MTRKKKSAEQSEAALTGNEKCRELRKQTSDA